MDRRVGVALIDEQPLFRDGVLSAFQRDGRFEMVATREHAGEAAGVVEAIHPDILAIDHLIHGGGTVLIEKLAAIAKNTKIVVLTASRAEADLFDTLKSGAFSFINKQIAGKDLCNTLWMIHQGQPFVPPNLAAAWISHLSCRTEQPVNRHRNVNLSRREEQILRHVAKGLLNCEIAGDMRVSVRTVKQQIAAIKRKLNVRNRVEAAMWLLGSEAG